MLHHNTKAYLSTLSSKTKHFSKTSDLKIKSKVFAVHLISFLYIFE